jgi:DNA-binding NarL/FixJ family response regulator
VSRRHCEITVAHASVTVADLDSRHGTFVEGVKVRSGTIREGQQVRFGRVVFLLSSENFARRQFDPEDETDDPRDQRRPTFFDEAISLLSPAERRVLDALLEGSSEKRVAHDLVLSQHTVHIHIRRIYKALDVHSRAELLTLLLSGSR